MQRLPFPQHCCRGLKVTGEGSDSITVTRSVRWRPASLGSGSAAVGVSDRFKSRGERSDAAFKATQSHKVSEKTSISGGEGKKKKEIHEKLCIKGNNVRLIQSVSTVKWVFVPGGPLWPWAVTLPSYGLHFLRLPLLSSLTAVLLKQMRSESCFD